MAEENPADSVLKPNKEFLGGPSHLSGAESASSNWRLLYKKAAADHRAKQVCSRPAHSGSMNGNPEMTGTS